MVTHRRNLQAIIGSKRPELFDYFQTKKVKDEINLVLTSRFVEFSMIRPVKPVHWSVVKYWVLRKKIESEARGGEDPETMRIDDEDLRAIYDHSRDLLSGTIQRREDGMVELINYTVYDWSKIASFAYYYITYSNAARWALIRNENSAIKLFRVNETIDQTLLSDIKFKKFGQTPYVFRNPKVCLKTWTSSAEFW